MAMTLPLASPSPVSDDNVPNTPVEPDTPTDISPPSNNIKRKPSRRANTAERRATHNAVERQRRETLNGRFLDLAALLPNLSQIRRPSKSSIVNSSIAHVHASRRHRILAARELRVLKLEADALRRELNEWRDRAGIPRVDEPLRGDGFSMVLSGELEVIAAVPGEDDEDGDVGGYGGHYMDEAEEEFTGAHPDDDVAAMMKQGAGNPFAHNIPPQHQQQLHLAHILPRPATNNNPMLPSPYDGPMGMYDGHAHFSAAHFMPPQQQQQQHLDSDKIAAWNAAQMYANNGHHNNGHPHHHQHHQQQQQQQQQIMQAQRSLFTPPATAHGLPSGSAGPSNNNGGNRSPVSPIITGNVVNGRGRSGSLALSIASVSNGSGSGGGSPTYAGGAGNHSPTWSGPGQNSNNGPGIGGSGGVGSGGGSPVYSGTNSPPYSGGSPPYSGNSPTYELGHGHAEFSVPRRGSAWGGVDVGISGMNPVNMVSVGGGGGGGGSAGFGMLM